MKLGLLPYEAAAVLATQKVLKRCQDGIRKDKACSIHPALLSLIYRDGFGPALYGSRRPIRQGIHCILATVRVSKRELREELERRGLGRMYLHITLP
ncbi:hypothetical protein CEXT_101851 [Caerostris extrusa]|uniref:Uncharacterized protein n=1 Tax=Caerostris extrusa TaxID=172846 RepID=A0AAV4Y5P0_CAEEX|nr:hypothetical protein CEXT_101851 [Caerostris extrusa]